jgi:hypothetical protein
MVNNVKVIHVANNNNNNNNEASTKVHGTRRDRDTSDDEDASSIPSVSSLSSSDADSISGKDTDTDTDSLSDAAIPSSASENGTASIVHGGGGAGDLGETASQIDTDDFLSQDPLYLVLSQFFLTSDKKRNIACVLSDLVDRLDKLIALNEREHTG